MTNPSPSNDLFVKLKKRNWKETLEHLVVEAEKVDTETRERPYSKRYPLLLTEALFSVGNAELRGRIESCSNHPRFVGKRYKGVCQSPWCSGCRNHLYLRHYSKVHQRLSHGRHIKTQYEEETPLLYTETKEKFVTTSYVNKDLRHITGVVGICPMKTNDLQRLIKDDTTKWRRIKRRLNKETDEVYWIEAVYELELVRWDKLRIAPESDYKKRQMKMLIDNYGERYKREPFLFVHFHGLTNLHYDPLTRVFGKEYWIGDKRIPKTNPKTGLYVQGLHKNKLLEDNIRKITSYPFKNPTRYKHSFIGSDYKNGEFFEAEELGRLMTIYDDFIGRQGKTIFRSMGNDAEVWFDVVEQWKHELKTTNPRRRKQIRPLVGMVSKLLKDVRRRGAGNLANQLTPYITSELIRKKIRREQQVPWKFQPVGLSQKEKKLIRQYQMRNNHFWDPIKYTDLPMVYEETRERMSMWRGIRSRSTE